MASPMRVSRARSKEAAVAQAAGKQTALMLSLTPRWSTLSSCFLRPWGPSLTMEAGMPRRSTALVCQKSAPEHSPAFSSSVICAMSALMSMSFLLYSSAFRSTVDRSHSSWILGTSLIRRLV